MRVALFADSSRKPQKATRSLLPQEVQLSAFVSNFSKTHKTWNAHVQACEWSGVTCDTHKRVVTVSWCGRALRGDPSWCHLPDSIHTLELGRLNYGCGNQLSGPIPTALFPHPSVRIALDYNVLCGKVELHDLPVNLQSFDISGNALEGELALEQLPTSISMFNAANAGFSGGISLSLMPANIKKLVISLNRLSGEVDLHDLPTSLAELYLHKNNFSGAVDLSRLPSNLERLTIDTNHFSGVLDLSSLPKNLKYLNYAENKFDHVIVNDDKEHHFKTGLVTTK